MVVLTLGVVQFQSYQEAQLDTITEADVEIDNYIPYANDNTLATLDKEASIQFDDDLPVLDGATALYPIYAAFAEAVYPEGTYNPDRSAVRRTQTDNAYTALLHEEVDIIFAPAPSSNQRAEAEELNVEFELTPLGREAFVFFVNETNPIESLTSEQLRSIYTGEVTNWAEVGGESGTIQAFQRPEGSGSQTALQQFIGEDELMDPPAEDRVAGMGGIITETADYRNHPHAIGYSFRFFATEMNDTDEVRLLAIDGARPTRENIANDSYPLSSEFYAITRAGEDDEKVATLVEWMIGPEGQTIVERTGYVANE